jgi:tripartite ATP-independent transporter DctP family solute receptor
MTNTSEFRRRSVLGGLGAATLALAVLAGGTAPAQAEPRDFTVSVIYGPQKPQALIWSRFGGLVDEKLPGEFDFNIVTDGALGGEKETTEGILLGSIDGALSTLANLTTWVPEGAVFDMPFVFRDQAHIDQVLSGPIGDEFKAMYEEEGFKVLGFITYGARHVIAKEPIETPADVDGKKMRVLQSPLHIELWRSLGANPTPVPITEAYNALETGVVDYMDMTMSGYHALKLFEVVPQFSRTAHIYALGVMYMSLPYWESLTPEQQDVFQAAADEAVPYFNELAAAEQEASLEMAVDAGASVVEVDQAVWREAMADFWESYAPEVGGMERIERIVATE